MSLTPLSSECLPKTTSTSFVIYLGMSGKSFQHAHAEMWNEQDGIRRGLCEHYRMLLGS